MRRDGSCTLCGTHPICRRRTPCRHVPAGGLESVGEGVNIGCTNFCVLLFLEPEPHGRVHAHVLVRTHCRYDARPDLGYSEEEVVPASFIDEGETMLGALRCALLVRRQ